MCEQCDRREAEYGEKLVEFERRYPKYCRTCGGSEVVKYRDDPSPAGVSLSPGYMDYIEPCPGCLGRGVCGLCGTAVDPVTFERVCGCSEGIEKPAMPEYECPVEVKQDRLYWRGTHERSYEAE